MIIYQSFFNWHDSTLSIKVSLLLEERNQIENYFWMQRNLTKRWYHMLSQTSSWYLKHRQIYAVTNTVMLSKTPSNLCCHKHRHRNLNDYPNIYSRKSICLLKINSTMLFNYRNDDLWKFKGLKKNGDCSYPMWRLLTSSKNVRKLTNGRLKVLIITKKLPRDNSKIVGIQKQPLKFP